MTASTERLSAAGPERFLRKIETTANLHHPRTLPLYDSGEAGGFLCYVMPFVDGESPPMLTGEPPGPRLRANPKMRAALLQLGYPKPATGGAPR